MKRLSRTWKRSINSNVSCHIVQHLHIMEEIRKPTVGRIVNFFPSAQEASERSGAASNGAAVVPAIVTQVFDWTDSYKSLNLKVFTDGSANIWAPSTQHKSLAGEGQAYWDWPVFN